MKTWEFLVFIAIIWLCVIISDARADEWAINTLLVSEHHLDVDDDTNEQHNGVGLSYMNGDQIYSVMRFRNSKDNMSTVLSLGRPVWQHSNGANLAFHASFATGYSDDLQWVPAPVLTFNYKYITFYHVPLIVTAVGLTFRIE